MKHLRLALILGIIPASPLLADTLEREDALKLPQTLITGNRQVEARSDSSSANTVFTRADIDRLQPTSLTDLLGRVPGVQVAEKIDATVVDMRFVKPMDEALVREMADSHELLVTIEENAIMGGAGAAVSEFLARENVLRSVLHLGLPDVYVEHAKPSQMLAECGLDAAGIEASVRQRMQMLGL